MPTGEYLVGLAFLCVTAGSAIAAAAVAVARRMPELAGALRVVAVAVVATAALITAHVLPAAATLLTRESAALVAVALLVAALLVPRRSASERDAPPSPTSEPAAADRALAALGVAIGAIWIALVAIREIHREPTGFDAASAYMPTAARWLQEGSIWGLGDWLPNFFFGASPGNGSVVVLASMLPFDNDFLARYAIFPFIVLLAVAIYALARELRATAPAATLIALMVAAAPVIVQPAINDALLDPILYFGLAAGIAFLLRHARTERSADLVIAGLALGIAFGTKFYGFTAVPIVIAVWLGARLWAGTPPRALLRQGAGVAGLVAALGGIWVLRNAIATGNPIFPVELSLGGLSLFSAPADPMREIVGSTLVSYLDQPGVWLDELRTQFRIATGIPLLVIAAGVAGAIVAIAVRARRGVAGRTDAVAVCLIAASALLAISYMATPYSALGPEGEPILAAANVRYGIPALIAAAGVAAYAAGALGGRSPMLLLLAQAVALIAFLDAIRIGVTAPDSHLYIAIAAGVLAVALWLGWQALTGRGRWAPARPSALAAAAIAAVLVVLAVAGDRWQRTYNASRYVTGDAALNHIVVHAPPGATVGLAGTWDAQGVAPIYPAFGMRLQNTVAYIGRDDDGLLQPHESREGFVSTLREVDPDLLVIGRALSPVVEQQVTGEPGRREVRWAESAGYEELIESDRLVLMARHG